METLSRRGAALIETPPLAPYIGAHFERAAEPWHVVDRPGGYIALCIAENKLMWDVFLPRLGRVDDVPAEALGYDMMIGSMRFREPLARFLGRRVLGRSVQAEQLAVVAGAGSVLELLFHAIADPGDGVLVPTPSYAGFWADLETRDELHVVPVPTRSDEAFALSVDQLDQALAASAHPIKALLFTNPDNPLGRVSTPTQVRDILEWGDRTGVHVVFDEVYALSVFGPEPFASAASLRETLGSRAHVVWAFSKDFGASGLRCGVLFSENADVLRAVDALAYWSACSGDTQHRLARIVDDEPWLDTYVGTMQDRLRATYQTVTESLRAISVPFIPADGGIFVVIDLRRHLSEPSFEAENALWRRILEEANVNLTPGGACRIAEPGFFRLCYASESTAGVLEGIRRFGTLLSQTD